MKIHLEATVTVSHTEVLDKEQLIRVATHQQQMYGIWPDDMNELLEGYYRACEFGDPLPGSHNRFWDKAEETVEAILENWDGEIGELPDGLEIRDISGD